MKPNENNLQPRQLDDRHKKFSTRASKDPLVILQEWRANPRHPAVDWLFATFRTFHNSKIKWSKWVQDFHDSSIFSEGMTHVIGATGPGVILRHLLELAPAAWHTAYARHQ